jgi:hypothetical protein
MPAVDVKAGYRHVREGGKGTVGTASSSPVYRGKSASLRFRARCQNFCCSHRFRRACQNQARPQGQYRAGKRPGCASWSRGPAAAVTVLRPRMRPQSPTVSPPSVCGSASPWSLFWGSVASRSPFPAQVHGSPLLSRLKENTSFVPIDRQVTQFVRSA